MIAVPKVRVGEFDRPPRAKPSEVFWTYSIRPIPMNSLTGAGR